ncbi:hypothetical protein BC351_29120 [Paenibacillus ferrarius]|uniref:Uncharacterized protein n=1 Tax=Paenibacillus ferrarius TaxID=1469647 RepID=A0A1V4HIT1_9BACL|nr:hypothetical protein BC351_29120 [Paenibacillus ferrarius]
MNKGQGEEPSQQEHERIQPQKGEGAKRCGKRVCKKPSVLGRGANESFKTDPKDQSRCRRQPKRLTLGLMRINGLPLLIH